MIDWFTFWLLAAAAALAFAMWRIARLPDRDDD